MRLLQIVSNVSRRHTDVSSKGVLKPLPSVTFCAAEEAVTGDSRASERAVRTIPILRVTLLVLLRDEPWRAPYPFGANLLVC